MFVEVGAERGSPTKIYYELHGSGTNKVLLIMGLSATCRSWDLTVEQLLKHGNYEICILDNRGVGDSDSPPIGYTIQTMALDTFDLLEHLGWKKNVFVAGISMGGMITLELVLHSPETFAAVALISTHAGRTLPTIKALWMLLTAPTNPNLELRAQRYCDIVFPQSWLDQPLPPESGFATNRDRIMTRFIENAKRKPLQTALGMRGQQYAITQHHVSPDRLRSLAQTGLPIQILTGTDDNLVRPSNSYYLADQLSAPLEVFQDSGHGLPSECPERFLDVLVGLMKKSPVFVDGRGGKGEGAVAGQVEETVI